MRFYFVLFLFIAGMSYSQKDTVRTHYKHLEVRKVYNVAMQVDSVNGVKEYKIDMKPVDKATYDKYHNASKEMQNCKPCILETYDANEKIIFRAVKYMDCPVGQWISYYPNGKIKEIGHYRENDSGSWEDVWNSGYCIKHGSWTFYDEKGKVLRTEKYNFGNLQEK